MLLAGEAVERHRREHNSGMGEENSEHRAIRELIEQETYTFLARDFDGWAACLVQDEGTRRLGACMGGIMDYTEGWDVHGRKIREMMERYPEPNPQAARDFRRKNWSIRVGGDMAWVTYDQYGPRSTDPFVTVGLSHQLRILERQDGEWKIAMLGFGDTSLEYYDFPAIRIDESLHILWMNDRAKEELGSHPALRKAGPRLHCVSKTDSSALRDVAHEMSAQSIMDYRPSIDDPRGERTRSLLVEGDDGMAHVIWLSVRDQMLILHFNDEVAMARQLDEARRVFGLSEAQTRLAGFVLDGLDMPMAAERMGVGLSTVKTHLQRLFDKTGARSQAALAATLLRAASLG